MPPKKYKKIVTKRTVVIQGFNIQGSNNILKGASVINNTAESGTAEEEIIIQGFNLTENSSNNDLEGAWTKDNKVVVNYESDNEKGSTDKTSKLEEKITKLKNDEEELKKLFKKSNLTLDNIKNAIKVEKEQTVSNEEQQKMQILEVENKKLQFKELIRERVDTEIKSIRKIEAFSTWFNDNCAIVINKEKNFSQKIIYNLWVVVFEPAFGKVKERINFLKLIKEITPIKENWAEIIESFQKALNSDYPVAALYNNIYTTDLPSLTQNYENIAKREERMSFQSNLDNYIKPLDIVRVDRKGGVYQHMAIYLGNRKVAHINNPLGKGSSRVRIDDWGVFSGNENIIEIHHTFIPFKKPELIRRHLDIAVNAKYGEGIYHLLSSNCEHFATMCVYGIGICKQKNINTVNKVAKNSDYLLQAIQESNEFFEELEKYIEAESLNASWTNISSSFTPKLIQTWQNYEFTVEQCKEWINIGLKPTDAEFCAWLRDIKQFTPEWVLNHGNQEQLSQEYFHWCHEQLQVNIGITPK